MDKRPIQVPGVFDMDAQVAPPSVESKHSFRTNVRAPNTEKSPAKPSTQTGPYAEGSLQHTMGTRGKSEEGLGTTYSELTHYYSI